MNLLLDPGKDSDEPQPINEWIVNHHASLSDALYDKAGKQLDKVGISQEGGIRLQGKESDFHYRPTCVAPELQRSSRMPRTLGLGCP